MENNTLLLDEYLRGEGTAAERIMWQNELATNPKAYQEAMFTRRLEINLQQAPVIAFARLVREAAAMPPPTSPPFSLMAFLKPFLQPLIGMGFAITVSVGIYWYFSNQNNTQNLSAITEALVHKNLRLAHSAPFPNTISVADTHALYPALQAYNKGHYKKSAELFITYRNTLVGHRQDRNVTFYLALSLFYDKKYEDAIPIFKELQRFDDPVLQPIADWHLALIYLKRNDVVSAKPLLEFLLSNPNYSVDAKELLETL